MTYIAMHTMHGFTFSISDQCTNVVNYLNRIEIFSCCWRNTEVGQHRAILLWPVPATAVLAPNQGGQRNDQAIFGLLLFDPFLHLFAPLPLVGWLSQMWWFRTSKKCPSLLGGRASHFDHMTPGFFCILGLWIWPTLVIGTSAPWRLFWMEFPHPECVCYV